MPIRSLREILSARPLVSVSTEATLREACALLDAENIGALAVLSDGALVGLLIHTIVQLAG